MLKSNLHRDAPLALALFSAPSSSSYSYYLLLLRPLLPPLPFLPAAPTPSPFALLPGRVLILLLPLPLPCSKILISHQLVRIHIKAGRRWFREKTHQRGNYTSELAKPHVDTGFKKHEADRPKCRICCGRWRIYYIWKHSKIRNRCVCHVDAAIWSIPIVSYRKGFWTMHSSQICHTQARARAKMRAHTLTDTDRCESVLQTAKNMKVKIQSLMR